MSFIVDPSDTSILVVKEKINTYIQTKPDFERWKDFYESSAGKILIDIVASALVVLSHRVITARREAYLRYAENRSSQVAIAENLGYNVFRGTNARVNVTIIPSETGILQKYDTIGSVSDKDLIVLDNTILNEGVPVTIYCTVGEIKEEELTVSTDLITLFRFTNPDYTSDVRLYLNDTEIIHNDAILSMVDGDYVLMSNGFGGVDVLTLNNGTINYATGDILKTVYIASYTSSFLASDIEIDSNYNPTEVTIATNASDPEFGDSIRIKAPLYHETQYRVRGRNDFQKLMLLQNPDLIEAAGKDISAAFVATTYLRENTLPYSPDEFSIIDATLNDESIRPHGVPASIIIHPIQIYPNISISITLKQNTSENVPVVVRDVVESFDNRLGIDFNLLDIEDILEDLSYVKIARVTFDLPDWESEELYTRGSFVLAQDSLLKALMFKRHYRISGSTEPTWTILPNIIIVDGGIIWESVQDDRGNLATWEAETEYEIGTTIMATDPAITMRFRVKEHIHNSGSTEPSWSEVEGELFTDNNLVWIMREVEGTPSTWEADTPYVIGDIVLPTTGTKMYQVISYRSESGTVEPDTDSASVGDEIIDGSLVWEVIDKNKDNMQLEWNEFLMTSHSLTIN